VLLHGEMQTPPMSTEARREAGYLIRKLQQGQSLSMPESRPMPTIGRHVAELRIVDQAESKTWRIIYRRDEDAIVIAEVFAKKSTKTPQNIITACKLRYRDYDNC
jgi:phage-related protein